MFFTLAVFSSAFPVFAQSDIIDLDQFEIADGLGPGGAMDGIDVQISRVVPRSGADFFDYQDPAGTFVYFGDYVGVFTQVTGVDTPGLVAADTIIIGGAVQALTISSKNRPVDFSPLITVMRGASFQAVGRGMVLEDPATYGSTRASGSFEGNGGRGTVLTMTYTIMSNAGWVEVYRFVGTKS